MPRAALVLAILLNLSFFPYVWGGKTLLSAAAEASSIYDTGALPLPPPGGPSIYKVRDPGAAAWQTEPDFAQIHRQLFGEKHFPLWNPSVGFGEPLAADMLSQPYFPLSLIAVVHPSTWTYDWWCIARLFVAGLGAFCFLRLFVPFWPALPAGISFMYSGYFLLYYDIAHLSVETLLPWLFFANERLIRAPRFSNVAAAAGINVCVYLGGMPESQLLALAFAFLYAMYRIASVGALRKNALRGVRALLVSALAGIGGAAFLLLPFIEFARLSFDQHQASNIGGAMIGTGFDHRLREAFTYVVPLIFGPPWNSILTNFSGSSGTSGFFGITAVYLALGGVFAAIGDRGRRYGAWSGCVPFFALSVAFFIAKRFGSAAVNWVGTLPGFSLIQFTKYDEPLLGFAVAVLAGFGVAHIADERASGVARWWAAVFALALLTFVYVTVHPLVGSTAIGRAFTMGSLLLALACLAIAAGFGAFASRVASRGWPPAAVAGVVAALALEANCNYLVPMHYVKGIAAPASFDPYRGAPFVSFLQHATAATHDRIFGEDGLLHPDWAGAFGLDDVRDLDAMYDRTYLPFVRDFLPADGPGRNLIDRFVDTPELTTPEQLRFLALSSIRYVASNHALGAGESFFGQAFAQNIASIPPERKPALAAARYAIGGIAREGLLEYPPFNRLPMRVDVPRGVTRFSFAVAMDPAVYASDRPMCGAGARFTLEVRDSSGRITPLFDSYIDPKHILAQRRWIDETVDVSRWSGTTVNLLLSTAPGPENNLCADRALWGGGAFSPLAPTRSVRPVFSLAYRDGETAVYRFDGALPRVSIFENVRMCSSVEAALALLSEPGFDITRSAAVTPSNPDQAAALTGMEATPTPVRAGLLAAYDSQYVRAQVSAARRSIVVLNDTFFPGWNAYVDGKPVPTLRANGLFRGVVVEPGEHSVEYKYEPLSFRLGVAISLATLAAGIAAGIRARGKRRDFALRDAA